MTKPERYFEDYPPGAVFEGGSISVSEAEIIDFAERYDPQPIHTDREAAARGRFGGLIASGWHTTALMMSPASSIASPGVDELRWLQQVRPGDELRLRMTVLEARPSRSRPEQGILRNLVELRNQRGDVVLSVKSVSLIRRRPA